MDSMQMIYTFKMPERFKEMELSDMSENECEEVMEESWKTIEQIEAEAVKRGCLLYRFVYEATGWGVAVYQIVEVNKISCKVRYCSLDGGQITMNTRWGSETDVGTKHIMKRVKSWDMMVGQGDNNIKVLSEKSLANTEELAYRLGKWFLYVQTRDEGYDFNIYDESFRLHDGGVYDDCQPSIHEVAQILLEDMKNELKDLEGSVAEPIDPEKLAEAAENANAILYDGIDPALLMRLIIGNEGDEVALKNICEAQHECMEELTDDEKKFLIETNSFYRSEAEFFYMHNAEDWELYSLIEDGTIVKTTDGFVYKNCV